MPASGWAFYFAESFDLPFCEVSLVFGVSSEIAKSRFISLCALIVICACSGVAARQSAIGDAAANKPATANPAAHKQQRSMSAGNGITRTSSSKKRSSRKKRVRGQQKIDSERAQAIQEALIREHYLSGEATGTWNQASEAAMRRYQADNGWQSKTVPDSRALIKLGLGPSKDHLLNPESAMTTVPDAPRAESMPTASHTGPPTTDTAPASSNQTDTSRPQ